MQTPMAVDSTCVVSLVDEGFYNQFFFVEVGAFVIQANQTGCFSRKHTAVDKCKFSHDEIAVGVVTCTVQWNRITTLCVKS